METAELNGLMFEALTTAYLAMLRAPHGEWRVKNQAALCACRDAIAESLGQTSQQIQDRYELMARLA